MRKRWVAVERLERIAHTAILGGYGVLRPFRDGAHRRLVHLDLAMDCSAPVSAELHARHSARRGKAVKPLTVTLSSRCRRCAACKERKAMFWQARALTEYERHFRTFFGTLTLRPEIDAQIDAKAALELKARGVDFYELDAEETFRVRVKVGGRLLTDWLKRLREAVAYRDGVRPHIRYLLIAEEHSGARTSVLKRGRPHWHVLVHELEDCRLVQPDEWALSASGVVVRDKWGNPFVADNALLRAQWTAGHSRFQLARSPQAAAYLCKYISKGMTYRVRCSHAYGHIFEENGDKTSEMKIEDKGRPPRENLDLPPVNCCNGTASASADQSLERLVESEEKNG